MRLNSFPHFIKPTFHHSKSGQALVHSVALCLFGTAAGRRALVYVKRYALVVLLVVVGSVLLLIAWVLVFVPNRSGWDPPMGLLLGTMGLVAWKSCDRMASALGKICEYARHFMQLAILLCPLLALAGGHSGGAGQLKGGWSSLILGSVLGIESFALLVWLSLTRSR